jgi:hypothetical protein
MLSNTPPPPSLERRGPRWRPPSISEIFAQLPFLQAASDETRQWLRAFGALRFDFVPLCVVCNT